MGATHACCTIEISLCVHNHRCEWFASIAAVRRRAKIVENVVAVLAFGSRTQFEDGSAPAVRAATAVRAVKVSGGIGSQRTRAVAAIAVRLGAELVKDVVGAGGGWRMRIEAANRRQNEDRD